MQPFSHNTPTLQIDRQPGPIAYGEPFIYKRLPKNWNLMLYSLDVVNEPISHGVACGVYSLQTLI